MRGRTATIAPTIGAFMFFIIILAALAWVAYQFFKYNTNAGAEAMRAYIYLEALLNGDDGETALRLASADMMELDTDGMRHILNEVRVLHGGRSLPLIAEAYRRGMPSRMPFWYQWSTSQCDPSPSVKAIYTAPLTKAVKQSKPSANASPEWMRSFTVYYTLSKLKAASNLSPIPDACLIPDDLLAFLEEALPQHLRLSLPASFRLYMEFAHPEIQDYDVRLIPSDIKEYLTNTMRHIGQEGRMRQLVQRHQTELQGYPMTEAELDELTSDMKQRQSEGLDIVQLMYGMGLLLLTEDEFRIKHGKSYHEFETELVAANDRLIIPNTDSDRKITP